MTSAASIVEPFPYGLGQCRRLDCRCQGPLIRRGKFKNALDYTRIFYPSTVPLAWPESPSSFSWPGPGCVTRLVSSSSSSQSEALCTGLSTHCDLENEMHRFEIVLFQASRFSHAALSFSPDTKPKTSFFLIHGVFARERGRERGRVVHVCFLRQRAINSVPPLVFFSGPTRIPRVLSVRILGMRSRTERRREISRPDLVPARPENSSIPMAKYSRYSSLASSDTHTTTDLRLRAYLGRKSAEEKGFLRQ